MTDKYGKTGQPFQGDADDIIDLAIREAGRRLRDEPGSFGETALVKLVDASNKAQERRAAAEAAAALQAKETSVLDVVRNSPLPAVKKRELVNKEIRRLRALITELEAEHIE